MATPTSIISEGEGEVREENFRHYKPAPVRHTCSVYFANVKIMFLLLREGIFPGESQLLRHRQWAWWRRGKFLFSGKFKKIFIRESSESSNGYVWFASWKVFCLSEHSRIHRWIILSTQRNFFKHSSLINAIGYKIQNFLQQPNFKCVSIKLSIVAINTWKVHRLNTWKASYDGRIPMMNCGP